MTGRLTDISTKQFTRPNIEASKAVTFSLHV